MTGNNQNQFTLPFSRQKSSADFCLASPYLSRYNPFPVSEVGAAQLTTKQSGH